MTDEKAGADTAKFKMKPQPGSPPGIELDGRGDIIPLSERTKEDRDAAMAASKADGLIKIPEGKTEISSPKPPSQRRRRSSPRRGTAGRQGGQQGK